MATSIDTGAPSTCNRSEITEPLELTSFRDVVRTAARSGRARRRGRGRGADGRARDRGGDAGVAASASVRGACSRACSWSRGRRPRCSSRAQRPTSRSAGSWLGGALGRRGRRARGRRDRPRPTRARARDRGVGGRSRWPSRSSSRSACTSRSASPTARSSTASRRGDRRSPATSAALALAVRALRERPERAARGRSSSPAGSPPSVGLVGYVAPVPARAHRADRARLQWAGVGRGGRGRDLGRRASVLNVLRRLARPGRARSPSASTVLVPLSLALGASDQLAVRIDRLLVHTITLAGLVGARRRVVPPHRARARARARPASEKTLLGLSMLAAAVAALLWVPARERLAELATRRVYGERHAPDEVLRTFGSRLTRALPLDELLLQLAESLKATMNLEVAEVWTRGAGRLERAVSVPDRGPGDDHARHRGGDGDRARRRVRARRGRRSGCPRSSPASRSPVLRIAPVTNSGELLGLIVVRRAERRAPVQRGRRPSRSPSSPARSGSRSTT